MRTNIDIDDKLMKQAMKATGAATKKATVEAALRQMVQIKAQGAIRKLRGKVVWRGSEDDWFASDEEIRKKHGEANQGAEPDLLKPVEPIEQRELVGSQGRH
jgi:Arc/MetJ family transcription regulator